MLRRMRAIAQPLPFHLAALALCSAALGVCGNAAAASPAANPPFTRAHYKVEVVVPPSAMHGVHGLAFGPDGALYGASLTGNALYRIDVKTGTVKTFVGPPQGTADDLAFAPDGTVYWSAEAYNALLFRGKDGKIRTAAKDVPTVNSLAFTKDGRLFFSTLRGTEALYEADPTGRKAPRLVADKLGGLNGFQIAADNTLYGPLFSRGNIVKMNIESGEVTVIADGFDAPSSVRIDAKGDLIAIDIRRGDVVHVDPKTGAKDMIANVTPPIDNFAIARDGTLYVSSPAYNGITAVNPTTHETHRVVWGGFSSPGMMTTADIDGREQILAADSWGPRIVDPKSSAVVALKRTPGIVGATSILARKDTYVLADGPRGAVYVVEQSSAKQLARLSGFGAPYDIKSLDDGFLVADYATGQLIKIADDADRTRTIVMDQLSGPVGLADAGNGTFYVSEYNSGDITQIALATKARKVILSHLKAPEGIALAPNGRLIIAEVGRKRVLSLEPSTGTVEILAENLDVGLEGRGLPVPAPFLPTGVTVMRDGAVFVTGDVTNTLYRITARP